MSEAKFNAYAKAILEFEEEIKRLKRTLADDSKRLITLSDSYISELRLTAEKTLEEIQKSIDNEKKSQIDNIRKEYVAERERQIVEIRKLAEKNVDKAVNEVIREILGALK
ncbi:hypothetical protein BFU36_03685 [Sulfolobus sp. A20]|uniref:hypothetical protein n=1 Tax=Sulfolobaceae TaxID=118883 RepID=UPI000845E2F8|nr:MULTISPECIES: hypothetical protein [unclassified Sulfolobus]TRM74798.1 hypothetical protein DJ523_04075 [Sulfolobus sp. E5]TRM76770.1 hypothetical protein DJ528_07810 [Sulfolobus sp. B5]TRM77603.1 hypothetical protein DJ532_04160 [Sulfolobus sp. A20-N-F8]TRM82175.1 hypothetical protein DJ531_09900 [Sulfolobus sp. A20-N-F6]TRM82319.1 hypothetical protein DJ524_00915 [Sulfolobus sp. D5]TRM85140.1 hypothetical protein DJ522_01905 [Sulfolobus sp. F3]TRM86651.1 hypothetical protein DJ521_05110